MKLIASITLKMKKVILPQFISTLYKHNFDINMINLTSSDGKWENYNIEIVYSSKKDLMKIIEALRKNNDFFQDIVITSTLEDKIREGVLKTTSKIDIDNINDVWTALFGGNKLIHEKIEAGLQKNYCACFNSVALISGLKNSASPNADNYYHLYTDAERDSVLISKFTDMNAYPVIVKYNTIEDMIRTINNIEDNFCCLRIMNNDEEEYLFSNIIDVVTKPVIFKELDENTLHYLCLINSAVRNHNIIVSDTSIGIIGLNSSTIRLTSLLVKAGFMKVLGHDINERQMMSFENKRGLATTIENVISNSDILLIMDENISYDYIKNFKAGQIIFSAIGLEAGDPDLFKNKGIRDLVKIEDTDSLSLMPALINSIRVSSKKYLTDELLIDIGRLISMQMEKKYELPGFYSAFNRDIETLLL